MAQYSTVVIQDGLRQYSNPENEALHIALLVLAMDERNEFARLFIATSARTILANCTGEDGSRNEKVFFLHRKATVWSQFCRRFALSTNLFSIN